MIKVNKILIFNPLGIGDVLCTTPLIRNLRENFPQAEISYICNARVYPLIFGDTAFKNVFIFEKSQWKRFSRYEFIVRFFKVWLKMRHMHFDVVIDLSMNSRYGFFLALCGIKKRIGLDYKRRGRFMTNKIPLPDGFSSKHVADYYLDCLRPLGIDPQPYPFHLTFSDEDILNAQKLLQGYFPDKPRFLVGICPGCGDSWGKSAYYRRWPQENFVELIKLLIEKQQSSVVLFGASNEQDTCDYIASHLSSQVVNLCGKLELKETSAALAQCDLILTNDGGPMHIVQSLGKKNIAFFGPVDENVYGHYHRDNSLMLTSKVVCRPCYSKFRFPECAYDKLCLRAISVEEAYQAVCNILIK